MIVVNFAHPLNDEQVTQLTALLGEKPKVLFIDTHVDRSLPLATVAYQLVEAVGLGTNVWQTERIVVNPPGLAPVALAVIAEIHGRSGFFPTIINIRPVSNTDPTRYEIAELVNLDRIRQEARTRRRPREQ